jgi:hypothetical protein
MIGTGVATDLRLTAAPHQLCTSPLLTSESGCAHPGAVSITTLRGHRQNQTDGASGSVDSGLAFLFEEQTELNAAGSADLRIAPESYLKHITPDR